MHLLVYQRVPTGGNLCRRFSVFLNSLTLPCPCSINHRGRLSFLLPDDDFGPNVNLIGIRSTDINTSPFNWFTEYPPALVPADLMSAQMAARWPPAATSLPGFVRPNRGRDHYQLDMLGNGSVPQTADDNK